MRGEWPNPFKLAERIHPVQFVKYPPGAHRIERKELTLSDQGMGQGCQQTRVFIHQTALLHSRNKGCLLPSPILDPALHTGPRRTVTGLVRDACRCFAMSAPSAPRQGPPRIRK
ncbi:hypothetical protein AAFF_G00161470 [Aldrovandia affinis]|uniref:Uncharacterized protein n=1 Tax=Aldrovandia affinis TaxID=143900 RepID=A0AAD7W865_9TELE|nr:hypothetical protein AAFF_G00161470 [Aldrovandia affinis]